MIISSEMNFLSIPVITSSICHVLWLLCCSTDAYIIVKSSFNETLHQFDDLPAAPSFGRTFPDEGLWGHIEFTDPPDACTTVEPPANTSDWFAVISMSDKCGFHEQVLNAQKAGYTAAIIHNNKSNQLIEIKGSSKQRLSIPSTFIGLSDSHLIAQYDRRLNVNVLIVEVVVENDELILIVLAAISSFSAITVLGIMIGVGIHNCYRNRAQLLSRWKLKRLPLHTFKKGDLYESCAICLEEYDEGEKLRILPCAHAFHSKCIDVWLTKNKKTCPLCNETVNPHRRSTVSSRDIERTPLLMPLPEDDVADTEHGPTSTLPRNQSLVEVHEEPVYASSVHRTNRQRNYGTVGVSSLVATAGEASCAQDLVAVGDSSLVASAAGETVPVVDEENRKRRKAQLESRPRPPQVVITGRNSDRPSDNIV